MPVATVTPAGAYPGYVKVPGYWSTISIAGVGDVPSWVPDSWVPGPAPTTLPTTHVGGVKGYTKQVNYWNPAELWSNNNPMPKNGYWTTTVVSVGPIYTDIWVPSTPTVIGHWTFTTSPNYGSYGSTGWTATY